MSDTDSVLIAKYDLIGDGPSRDDFEALLIGAGYELEQDGDGSILVIDPDPRLGDRIDPDEYHTFDSLANHPENE